MSIESAAMSSVAFRVAFLGRRGFTLSRGMYEQERAEWVTLHAYILECVNNTSLPKRKADKIKMYPVTVANAIRAKRTCEF